MCIYIVLAAPFVEETVIYSLRFWHLVSNQMTRVVQFYFWDFCCTPWSMFLFLCLQQAIFVIMVLKLQISYCSTSSIDPFACDCLGYLQSFVLSYWIICYVSGDNGFVVQMKLALILQITSGNTAITMFALLMCEHRDSFHSVFSFLVFTSCHYLYCNS